MTLPNATKEHKQMMQKGRAFVYTLDVLIGITLIAMLTAILPTKKIAQTPNPSTIYAESLLLSAEYNGTLENIAKNPQGNFSTFIENVDAQYCAYGELYKINTNNLSLISEAWKNGCSSLPDAYYVASRTVLVKDSNPPSGQEVYGFRVYIWPKPS